MRTLHRIEIGLLVGLFFAGGYAARLTCAPAEPEPISTSQHSPVLAPGTPIAAVGLAGAANVDFKPLETLINVTNNLRQHYVEQITGKEEGKMTYDALRSMLAALDDPNTRFVEPAQKKVIEAAEDGKFSGIGAILGIKRVKSENLTEEHLVVITPLESGPAAQAGLQPGDDIIAIDGGKVLPFNPYQRANLMIKAKWESDQSTLKKQIDAEQKVIDTGIPILEAESRLATENDKEIELTVVRKGSEKEIKVKLTPREFTVEPVVSNLMENGKLGYIKVNCFSRTTGSRFADALRDLSGKGAEGLVIDLRNVAGGHVESVLEIATLFAPGKQFAMLQQSRGRKSQISIPAGEQDDAWKKPVVVLVNKGTARIPEILAAALRDNRVARIVGEKTYGDFSYSTLIEQRDGSAVMLTTGVFLTSKGGDYNGQGLPVDVEVTSSAAGDAQLREAIKLVSAREGRS